MLVKSQALSPQPPTGLSLCRVNAKEVYNKIKCGSILLPVAPEAAVPEAVAPEAVGPFVLPGLALQSEWTQNMGEMLCNRKIAEDKLKKVNTCEYFL